MSRVYSNWRNVYQEKPCVWHWCVNSFWWGQDIEVARQKTLRLRVFRDHPFSGFSWQVVTPSRWTFSSGLLASIGPYQANTKCLLGWITTLLSETGTQTYIFYTFIKWPSVWNLLSWAATALFTDENAVEWYIWDNSSSEGCNGLNCTNPAWVRFQPRSLAHSPKTTGHTE